MEKKARLGRGLDALLGTTADGTGAANGDQAQVPLERIENNPYQPRKAFDEEELASLSASIRTHGILQPLVVRKVGDRYQLIAGERRLRAAKDAGMTTVPVRVVNFNDQQVLEAALVENIHRADLNPIEKAQGFKEYLDRFEMTHDELAKRLGLARPTITNLVGLLELPSEVQGMVRVGQITLGHAKILKGITDRDRQLALCKEIIAKGLSVHATEAHLKQQAQPEPVKEPPEPQDVPEKTAHVQGIEDELRQKLATKVEIRVRGKDKGQIVLGFESNDDFERILEVLRG
jgi:ParB family transcriptional regulator, chromosome partitioning protein